MSVGNYLWKGFNGALDYGFRKLDESTAYVSNAAFVATGKIIQTAPDDLCPHRFSPDFYGAMLWIEGNPIAVNRVVNISMLASDIYLGNISLDSLTHLLQLFGNEKTTPKCRKLLILLDAMGISQIATNQLLGTTNQSIVHSLIESCVHVHNIHYNNVLTRKYIHNKEHLENKEN